MKIYIAPMAGITDYSFRKITEKFHPDFLFTEMVNAHLLENDDETTRTELLKVDNTNITGTQIFGSDKQELINGFLKLESLGFKKINLNMGCPQPKIIKNGAGSALLENYKFIENLFEELMSKIKKTTQLSIKIRTGYKDFNNPELYLQLANKFNLDFICVHGRTQQQIYGGKADWEIVKKLSNLDRNINFFGNGDLFEAHDIVKKIKNCNLDGIMLSRGVIGNPWLIPQVREILQTGKISTTPSFEDIKNTLLEHLELIHENKGEIKASLEINKFIRPYFKDYQTDSQKEKFTKIITEKNLSSKIQKIKEL